MRGFLFAFKDDVPGNNAFMDLFRVGFVMLKKIKKCKFVKILLTLFQILYIFFVTVAQDGGAKEKVCGCSSTEAGKEKRQILNMSAKRIG